MDISVPFSPSTITHCESLCDTETKRQKERRSRREIISILFSSGGKMTKI